MRPHTPKDAPIRAVADDDGGSFCLEGKRGPTDRPVSGMPRIAPHPRCQHANRHLQRVTAPGLQLRALAFANAVHPGCRLPLVLQLHALEASRAEGAVVAHRTDAA